MHFEKRPNGGHVVFDPGDHELLDVPESTSEIAIDSPEFEAIATEIYESISAHQIVLESHRLGGNSNMFRVHGEIVAMQGLFHEIQLYRSMARHPSAATNKQLWYTMGLEPPVDYDKPQIDTPAPTTVTQLPAASRDFDPLPPTIA